MLFPDFFRQCWRNFHLHAHHHHSTNSRYFKSPQRKQKRVVEASACTREMGGSHSSRNSPLAKLATLRSLHIVMLGLDSAGKTTVLYRLKFNEFVNTVPTIGFNMEKVRPGSGGARGVSFQFWDVGGQERLRPLWRSYTRRTDGVVFVVDSVDAERLEEARTELHRVARTPECQGVPVLVVANKQDLPAALAPAEVERLLALAELGPAALWHLQPACAIIGEGLSEGLDKLYEMILRRRKMLKQQQKKKR